jgi:hypothetical protein
MPTAAQGEHECHCISRARFIDVFIAQTIIRRDRRRTCVSLRARIHTSVAALLISAYGIWMLTDALKTHYWATDAIGAALLGTAGGTVTSQRWSRFLVYAFAAVSTLRWLWIVGGQITSGLLIPYLKEMPLLKTVLVSIPAGAMFVLTGYCCYVASRHLGTPEEQV